MIEAVGLTKRLEGRAVLDGVDAVVRPGEITAVVGPSGGGKTTLLRTLALVQPPDAGRIAVDGWQYLFPAAGNPLPPWPRLTVVFQQFHLWPHLTLRRNIELPLRCAGTPGTEIADRVAALAERFGMERFLDRYPNQVSGGQQQRAALTRALALRPAYLLLDEITSALDREQARILFDHLAELKREGMGLLLVTHAIDFAREAADTVLFLDQGRLAERGGPEVLSSPKTERVRRFLAG